MRDPMEVGLDPGQQAVSLFLNPNNNLVLELSY